MSARGWQLLLLLPQPPLTLLYLLAIRSQRVRPSFTPVILLGLLPVAALVVAVVAVRPRQPMALLLAVLEIALAVLAAAMVGFAIAWRSG